MPPMGLIILLLLIAFPMLEIAVLIKVGSALGVWLTWANIIGTFILGTLVLRLQGFGVMRRFLEMSRSGQPPLEPMLEGMLLMFAGGCLILPGFITDAIGLLLLVPPIRQATARWILSHGVFSVFVSRSGSVQPGGSQRDPFRPREGDFRSGGGQTIEADYERIDERPARNRPVAPRDDGTP